MSDETILVIGRRYVEALQLPEKWAKVVSAAFIKGAFEMLRQCPTERKPRGLEKFVRRLATDGGSLVCTSALTYEQVQEARNDGRLFVMADGLGFAIRNQGAAK